MGKYIDCHNCQEHYDCERTYLGGCFDGKEFEEETEKAFVDGWEKRKAEVKDKKETVIETIQKAVGGCARNWASLIADALIEKGLIADKSNAEQKVEIERRTEENRQLVKIGNGFALERNNMREELKTIQNSCQSKNAKIKNLNAEKEDLQNELNFQNGKPHYRYVIWNTKKNERQFPRICEMTENGASLILDNPQNAEEARAQLMEKFKLACNKLAELEDKIEQGKMIELACKKGDKVYQTDCVRVYELTVLGIRVFNNKFYYETQGVGFDNTAIGESIFLTREEAEKRLKELQNG